MGGDENEQQYGSSANTFRNVTVNGTAGNSGPTLNEIQILSTTFDAEAGIYTMNYSTPFADGVDVYYSDDLRSWAIDGNEDETGVNLTITRESPGFSRYFALVNSGQLCPEP